MPVAIRNESRYPATSEPDACAVRAAAAVARMASPTATYRVVTAVPPGRTCPARAAKLLGVAGQVNQHVDAIGVRPGDGLGERRVGTVDGLGGPVTHHAAGLGGGGGGVDVSARVSGELGQKRADAAGCPDDEHCLAIQRRQRLGDRHCGAARGGQRGRGYQVKTGRDARQRRI